MLLLGVPPGVPVFLIFDTQHSWVVEFPRRLNRTFDFISAKRD